MFNYFPLYYFFKTRLKNINWIIKYLIFPIVFLLLLIYSLWEINIIFFIINFIMFYNFYEIFYYYNDYSSYKNEIKWIKRSKWNIDRNLYLFLKIIITIFFLFIILIYTNYNINLYLLILFITWVVFFIHNNIKEKFRYITFILLYFLNTLNKFFINNQI